MNEATSPLGPLRRTERKVRQRHAIAQVAKRLFVERGFDNVTVADVARTAQVAEATVYNHFPSKEDLIFDRQTEMEDDFARAVRGRRAGESIAAALKRDFLANFESATERVGEGTDASALWRMVQATPRLQARLTRIGQVAVDRLAEQLAAEGLCAPNEELTLTIASLAAAVPWSLHTEIRRRVSQSESFESVRVTIHPLAEQAFALLSDGIGGFGTRWPRAPTMG